MQAAILAEAHLPFQFEAVEIDPPNGFHLFLDLYQSGKVKLEELATQRYWLDQINEAYASMLTGDVARGVFVF